MSKQFEIIPLPGIPDELRECAEYLQQQIAKAMYIPPHLLRVETHHELVARAYERTEVMRRELTKLYMEHGWPEMMMLERDL